MKKACSLMLAVLLATLLCAGLSGCNSTEPSARTSIKIGIALYDEYDTFVGELIGQFERLARLHEQQNGVTITLVKEGARRNQVLQNSQVQGFIQAGCDILCINLVDRSDASVIIDQAIAANIPVLFFNRELVEEDLARSDLLYYVGADAMESGRLQGELAADLWFNNPNPVDKNGDGILQYVMLEGEEGHQDAIVRTETSIKAVTDAGIQVERLEDQIANWSLSQAESFMLDWLNTHGAAIEMVFANNDDMALGAIEALKRTGIPPDEWPSIVGIDGTSVGLNSVLLGEMSGTVYNDAFGQGQKLLELACALAFGDPMPQLTDSRYIRLPYQLVTPLNVAEFIALGKT